MSVLVCALRQTTVIRPVASFLSPETSELSRTGLHLNCARLLCPSKCEFPVKCLAEQRSEKGTAF